MKRGAIAIVAIAIAACTPSQPKPSPPSVAQEDAATPVPVVVDAAVEASAPEPPSVPEDREKTFAEVLGVLFADRASTASVTEACAESMPPGARVRCLYDERYKGDAKAAGLAYEMLTRWRIVAGVEIAHTMNGGYRGEIQLEPFVPTGAERKHLEWAVAAFADFERFFRELDAYGKDHDAGTAARAYGFRGITYRFTRSKNVNRPSAYALDWTIGYNVRGSINLDSEMVRETLFHEIFHLNDPLHGAGGGYWSGPALSPIFDAIVAKCGTNSACLAPYTPNETMVRGGTYYSFQPGNGVIEYAAELALRYYREQRAAMRGLSPKPKAFKCGPPENARAWTLMKDEFFRGIDATPACP
ncbi:MAG TPA: hypothetical protein VIF62_04750 [Labilithrix sp.]|jgi:hypothetical protein